jgi:hypothetical protein
LDAFGFLEYDVAQNMARRLPSLEIGPLNESSTTKVRNAMSYTLTTAARAVALNKTTILRVIKSGKISGAKDEHGEWHIEPSELH